MEATRTDEKFAPNPEVKLHFLDYWRIIRLRKTVILAVFLLVALTTTVVTFFLPKSYSSFVRISIVNDVADVDANIMGPRASGGLMFDPYRMQTEFQRIQSRPVLERVVQTLNLQEEWTRKFKLPTPLTKERAYEILKGSINVKQSQNSTLVEIHAYSDDKDEAAKIANAVAEVYREVRRESRDKVTEGGLAKLREELTKRDLVISNASLHVNKLRKDLNISDLDAAGNYPTATLDQETLRKIDSQLLEAQRNFLLSSNLYAELSPKNHEELKHVAPLTTGDNQLAELIQQENSAELRLVSLTNNFGMEHSEVRGIIETLRTVRRQITNRLDGIIAAAKSRMDTERRTMDAYAKQKADAINFDLENFARTRPYYDAKEELLKLKMLRDRLEVNVQAQEVELSTPRVGSVEVIDPAVAIDKPVKPNKKLNIALGVIIGLILGVGLAFFIEYLDTSVKTIDDVERALQAPVLGVIPQNVGLLIDEGPESPHGEAYRVLRTNVLFSRKDPKLNTLTVVSGGAGEGKSTTIFNLATVFAQNGQRVLIIDSDLRRPSLHRFLKVSNAIGLTDFLMKRHTLEEVIQTTPVPTLDFLPSGKLPSSSLGILSSVQMKELIRDVKRRYDFVFFDSPPIMGVSDASILASEVDMVLQVIQYRRYPQPMTIRAKQMIEKVGGNLLGIVLNNINMSQDENYYYYSGYYYDYYNKGEYTSDEKKAKPAAATAEQGGKTEIKSKF